MKLHVFSAAASSRKVLRALARAAPSDVLLVVRWSMRDGPIRAVPFLVRAVKAMAGALGGSIGSALKLRERPHMAVLWLAHGALPPEEAAPGTVIVRCRRVLATNLAGAVVVESLQERRGLKTSAPPFDFFESVGAQRSPDLALPEAPPPLRDAELAASGRKRQAYGALLCPDEVDVGATFEVKVGLSEAQLPNVTATRMQLPDVPRLELVVTLLPPPGFTLGDGEAARNTLVATKEVPFPKLTLHLSTSGIPRGEYPIGATFALGGEVIGAALRKISIGRPARPQPTATLPLLQSEGAPDLTVTILQPDQASGKLRWSFETPHPEAREKLADLADVDIGLAARDFARAFMQKLPTAEQAQSISLLRLQLLGAARTIAAKVPAAFFEAVRAIHAKQKRPPAVFFLSQEPYVPWELMAFEPPLDPAAPAVLGAQADVGRWIFDQPGPPPPPMQAGPGPMAVLSGGAGLQQGEDEVFQLQEDFGAISVAGSVDGLNEALHADPPNRFVHVSTHGAAPLDAKVEGLDLKGGPFDALAARGLSPVSGNPFLFLNACEVGQGAAVLGTYAGLAAAFTYVGAGAVIAPLWAIRDGIARSVVTRFYKAVASGTPVAAALRAARTTFLEAGVPASATYLAYQFFGHPRLKLTLPAQP